MFCKNHGRFSTKLRVSIIHKREMVMTSSQGHTATVAEGLHFHQWWAVQVFKDSLSVSGDRVAFMEDPLAFSVKL
jgi:hypothetical protein